MRLYTTLAVTAAAAALTFNFWSSESTRPIVIDDMQPVIAEAEDDLTLMLRHEARTAMFALQQRQDRQEQF